MRFVGYLISGLGLSLAACGPLATPPQADSQSGHPAAVSSPSDRLKQTIAQAMPELQNPKLDDWTKVNLLRRWAYRQIDVAYQTCSQNAFAPDVSNRDAATIFADFVADRGGVWCAGASDSLLRLYQLYGYKAYSIHFGDKQSLTHTVTLVQIQHQGKPLLVVQDAYLNTTITDAQGQPLAYWDLLQRLQSRHTDQVTIVQQQGDRRDAYYCGQPKPDEMYYDSRLSTIKRTPIGPNRSKFSYGLTLATFEQHHRLMPKTKQFIAQQGYPTNFKYLFLFPYYASDGNNAQPQLVQQAKQIIQGQSLAAEAHVRTLKTQ